MDFLKLGALSLILMCVDLIKINMMCLQHRKCFFIRMLDFMQIKSNYANEEYANELICKLSVISEKCVVTAFIWHLIYEYW